MTSQENFKFYSIYFQFLILNEIAITISALYLDKRLGPLDGVPAPAVVVVQVPLAAQLGRGSDPRVSRPRRPPQRRGAL